MIEEAKDWPISSPKATSGALFRGSTFDRLVTTQSAYSLPEVSVIIPVFESHATLRWVLVGLSLQDYPHDLIEVVVVDDGGDRPYPELAERDWPWSLHYARRKRTGYSVGAARNLGARIAKGDVLVFLDGDSVPDVSLVRNHAAWYGSSKLVGLPGVAVFGPRRFVALPSSGVPRDRKHAMEMIGSLPRIASVSNFGQSFDRRGPEIRKLENHPFAFHLWHGCNASVTKSGWDCAGGFNPEFDGHWGYEDTEFAYRLSILGVEFIAEPRALAFHLEDPVRNQTQRALEEAINFRKACEKIPDFKEFKDRLRKVGRIPWW